MRCPDFVHSAAFFWTVSALVNYVDLGLSPACQESCNLPAPSHHVQGCSGGDTNRETG